jgi:amino acid adenylation domain-containing protein
MTIEVSITNRTFVRFEKHEVEQSVTDRFEKIVRLHGERLAVKSPTGQLTYNELNQIANRVAWSLLDERGDGQEPVGLLVDEECQAIAAMLGIMKSGRFYIPLSRSTPPDRFTSLLVESQVRRLITDRKRIDWIRKLVPEACVVFAVDDLVETASTNNLGLTMSPDDIAAVFYTSGSTGHPKGVIQNHRNVLHRVMLTTNSHVISPDDRLALLTAPTYSASIRNLFGGLLNGASVYPFKILEHGMAQLSNWFMKEGLTTYQSVPSVFRQWASNFAGTEDFSRLRLIILGGEPTLMKDVELYKRHFSPDCVLVGSLSSNETGPLRNFVINKTTEITSPTVPAGYEVEDKEILILDESGAEVEQGQVGEIAVRSEFLSPGYWRRPELTAAAFRQDPDFPDKRIYHTGDLGSLMSDGCLVYRGRKDFRAKIRGIRVEVEEIEAALLLHPSVKESVTVARSDDEGGTQTLVAYVVPSGDALESGAMRAFLAQKLPDYMLPSAFVFLTALPRKPNGKVDRQSLPAPEKVKPPAAAFVPPRDALEGALTNMWETMLHVHPIGVAHNFFELGGDSLAALQMILRIEDAFGKELQPAELFRSPTIEQLAAILRQHSAPNSWSSLVKLQSGACGQPVFCMLYAGGFKNEFFSFARLAAQVGTDYSFYALMARGTDGVSQPHRTVEEMAAAYISEMKTVQPEGPYMVVGECFSAPVAYEVAQQLRKTGERTVFLGMLDGRMRRHWYYRVLGRRLGARMNDCISTIQDSETWMYLKEAIPAVLRKLRIASGAERMRYVYERLGRQLRAETRAIARRSATGHRPESKQRADASMAYRLTVRIYEPKPYPGSIALIANEEWCKEDPTFGWRASGGVEVHSIPGTHNTYMRDHSKMVADVLKKCLAQFERDFAEIG